jgi:hypothetical protein
VVAHTARINQHVARLPRLTLFSSSRFWKTVPGPYLTPSRWAFVQRMLAEQPVERLDAASALATFASSWWASTDRSTGPSLPLSPLVSYPVDMT